MTASLRVSSRLLSACLATLLLMVGGCSKNRQTEEVSTTPPQKGSADPVTLPLEEPPEQPQPPEPTEDEITIGAPTESELLPENWPPQIPLPPGFELERLTEPDFFNTFVAGSHAASADALMQWFVVHMNDDGWLVLRRDRVATSNRVRMARETERWLLVVGTGTGDGGDDGSWVEIRRQMNEDPVSSVPGRAGARDCEAALAVTGDLIPQRCELSLGPAVLESASTVLGLDAAVGRNETAMAFVRDGHLQLMTVGQFELSRGPVQIRQLEGDSPVPQVVAGADDGWLVSWLEGTPSERVVVHVDERLRPTRQVLRMSEDLGLEAPAAFVPVVVNDREEYAVAWLERQDETLVFRVAGLKRDAQRMRRSGRFPTLGAVVERGPFLTFDGDRHLGLAWASADGLLFRAVGTDGLPDDHERQLEPGRPDWVGMTHAFDSLWVVWRTPTGRTAWRRTDVVGCVDNARGFLLGEPQQVWAGDLGPVVQVRTEGETTLARLSDPGFDELDETGLVEPEILGRTTDRFDWVDMEPIEGGFTGLVEKDDAIMGALWTCEAIDEP